MAGPPPPKLPPRPGRIKVFKALYNYNSQQPDELSFQEGDILYVVDDSCDPQGWWRARCGTKSGLIPSNYVSENTESIDFPLHEAARRGNLTFMNECLQNKISVNGLDKSGSTAVYWAAHSGHLDCLKTLMAAGGASINAQNKLGDTALHAASWKGHKEVVDLLLQAGANPQVKNKENKTAAALATSPDVAAVLKRASGSYNVDVVDYEGSDGNASD